MTRGPDSRPGAGALRQRLIDAAVRLLADSGDGDAARAIRKAASRLDARDESAWPGVEEVAAALAAYRRLFHPGRQELALRQRREVALRAMEFLADFQPRLAGEVASGSADAQSPVLLHLHAEDPDAVARWLDERGIDARPLSRRVRIDRQWTLDAPGWSFHAESVDIQLLVLPLNALRQAPLAAGGDAPMERLSAGRLRLLLAADASDADSAPPR